LTHTLSIFSFTRKIERRGFHHFLALKDTRKELEISAMIIQHLAEADCIEDEYEVRLAAEHIDETRRCGRCVQHFGSISEAERLKSRLDSFAAADDPIASC
jgi:hypothetical protein